MGSYEGRDVVSKETRLANLTRIALTTIIDQRSISPCAAPLSSGRGTPTIKLVSQTVVGSLRLILVVGYHAFMN